MSTPLDRVTVFFHDQCGKPHLKLSEVRICNGRWTNNVRAVSYVPEKRKLNVRRSIVRAIEALEEAVREVRSISVLGDPSHPEDWHLLWSAQENSVQALTQLRTLGEGEDARTPASDRPEDWSALQVQRRVE